MSAIARLMTKAQVRDLLGGIANSTLSRWIDAGLVPGPLPGTLRWDRVAVERALDRASGLADAASSEEEALIARARSWGASA